MNISGTLSSALHAGETSNACNVASRRSRRRIEAYFCWSNDVLALRKMMVYGKRKVELVRVLAAAAAFAQTRDGQWRAYGGDIAASRYAPLDQIDKSNVAKLGIAWRRPAVDASIMSVVPRLKPDHTFRATPLMIDGVLYSPNGIGFVEAFDAGT